VVRAVLFDRGAGCSEVLPAAGVRTRPTNA
jgi:hypothetical protein